jgi:hypothetical protein
VVPPPHTSGDGFPTSTSSPGSNIPSPAHGSGGPSPTPSNGHDYLLHIGDNNIAFPRTWWQYLPLLHMAASFLPLQPAVAAASFPTLAIAASSSPYLVVTSPLLHMAAMSLPLHPTTGFPSDGAPPSATDDPSLDIRWGLLRDAQKIRISMHLSLIWQIFSSKIIFINISSHQCMDSRYT